MKSAKLEGCFPSLAQKQHIHSRKRKYAAIGFQQDDATCHTAGETLETLNSYLRIEVRKCVVYMMRAALAKRAKRVSKLPENHINALRTFCVNNFIKYIFRK